MKRGLQALARSDPVLDVGEELPQGRPAAGNDPPRSMAGRSARGRVVARRNVAALCPPRKPRPRPTGHRCEPACLRRRQQSRHRLMPQELQRLAQELVEGFSCCVLAKRLHRGSHLRGFESKAQQRLLQLIRGTVGSGAP